MAFSYVCFTTYADNPSSTPAVAGGFTYGEIILSIFSFIGMLAAMAIVFHLIFRRTKIRN